MTTPKIDFDKLDQIGKTNNQENNKSIPTTKDEEYSAKLIKEKEREAKFEQMMKDLERYC